MREEFPVGGGGGGGGGGGWKETPVSADIAQTRMRERENALRASDTERERGLAPGRDRKRAAESQGGGEKEKGGERDRPKAGEREKGAETERDRGIERDRGGGEGDRG